MAHRLAAEAIADLESIWMHIARSSGRVERAEQVQETIIRHFLTIAQCPLIGRERDDLGPGLRSFPSHTFVIIYLIDGDDVLILHVMDGRRDIESLV